MDPEAALQGWRESIEAEDWDAAVYEYGAALRDWLRNGGFEPAWQAGEREVFYPAKERLR